MTAIAKWRLPTKAECMAAEFGKDTEASTLKCFLQNTDDIFWTSTGHETDDRVAYTFNLHHGYVSCADRFLHQRTRLVRESVEVRGTDQNRFSVSSCGTYVTDHEAKLDWQVNAQPSSSPWPRAIWRYEGRNVLPELPLDINSSILAIQNALIGKKESLHLDYLLAHFNQLSPRQDYIGSSSQKDCT